MKVSRRYRFTYQDAQDNFRCFSNYPFESLALGILARLLVFLYVVSDVDDNNDVVVVIVVDDDVMWNDLMV